MAKVATFRAALERGILPRPFGPWLDEELIAQLSSEELDRLISLWLNDPFYSPAKDEFHILKYPNLMTAFVAALLRIAEPIADAALTDNPDKAILQRAREASRRLGYVILRNMPAELRPEYMAQLTSRLYDAYVEASFAANPEKVATLKRAYYIHLALYAITLNYHNEYYYEGKQCDMNDFQEWLFLWPGLSDCKDDWDTCVSETVNGDRQLDVEHPHCFVMCEASWLNRLYELHRLARVSVHIRPVYEKLAHAFVELSSDNALFLPDEAKYISSLPSPWNMLPPYHGEIYVNYRQLALLHRHKLPLTTESLYALIGDGVIFPDDYRDEARKTIVARYGELFYHMLPQALAYERTVNENFNPKPTLYTKTLYLLGFTQPGMEKVLNDIVKMYIKNGKFGDFYTDARTYVRLKAYIPEHIALATRYYLEDQNYTETDLAKMAEVVCNDDTIDDELKLAVLMAVQVQSLEDISALIERYMPGYKQPINRWQALNYFVDILNRYWEKNT